MTDIYTDAMTHAYVEARLSKDPSTQLGAVLLGRSGQEIGFGYNHFPKGIDAKYWTGPKEDKYERVAHAEISAILSAARAGFATAGSTLVCPWAACANCAKYIAEAGVKTLVRHIEHDPQSDWIKSIEIGDEILRDCGVKVIEIEPVPTDIRLVRGGKPWVW